MTYQRKEVVRHLDQFVTNDPFSAVGKQVLWRGVHYADAACEKYARAIVQAMNNAA